jgi:hypothetical protein
VSWLSSALLLACGLVAIRLAVERAMSGVQGVVIATLMIGLSLDEQFLIHERLQLVVQGPWMSALVAAGGGLVAAAAWRSGLPGSVKGLWLCAVGVGLVGLLADAGAAPSFLARLEEGVEVVAEVLFLSGLLAWPVPHVHSRSFS